MIQLPKTLKEYTGGKLWYEGIDKSIAERIIAGYDKVQSIKERDERKMYIAHYFCEIGNYAYAAEIINCLLLEGKYVEELIELMRKLSVEDDSIDDFERISRFAKENPESAMQKSWLSAALSIKLPASLTKSYQVGSDGYVVSSNGRDYYYKNGKLEYSIANRDYDTYINTMSVRYYANEGQYKKALSLLNDINLNGTTTEIKVMIYTQYVEAYCELREYDSAFEYCKKLIENDVYIPHMSDVFYALYLDGSQKADVLKEFLMSYKGYKIVDLCDMHSLSGEIENGESFWNAILENNPIPDDDICEDTVLLRGMLHFNAGEILLAKKDFAKLANLCGSFGRGHMMLKYLEYYEENLANVKKSEDLPDKFYTSHLDWIQNYVGKKMSKKLKKIKTAEEFDSNCEENIAGLKSMLNAAQPKIGGIFEIIDRLYNTGSVAAQDVINMSICNSDYSIFVRSICFAQYLINKKPEKVVMLGREYNNYVADFPKDVSKRNFVYGAAMFCACAMQSGLDREEINKQMQLFNKLCDLANADFSDFDPCAVFGVLFSYASGSKKLRLVGTVMKRNDAKDFIYALMSGLYDSDGEYDDDLCDFILKVSKYLN